MKKLNKKLGRDDISLALNFDVFSKYGDANVAVLYQNIRFWIKKNEQNKTNSHDGKYWMYNSIDAFQQQFPMWSYKTIRNMIGKLVKDGYLVSGTYNTMKADRTVWYALGDTL